MDRLGKSLSLCLFAILAVSSLLIVNSTYAQTIPKPSAAPEFTLKYVDYSYDVPPVYGINPYNGNTEITENGYHVYKQYIEVWIKNQFFQKYIDTNNHKIVLGYNIHWKGHYENEWANATYPAYLLSSNSEYTVVSFAFGNDANDEYHYWLSGLVSPGDQLDFRVASFIGYYNIIYADRLPVFGSEARTYLVFTGQTSEFSNEQTILLNNDTAPIVSPDPNYAPTNPFTSGDNSPIPTPSPEPITTATLTPTKTPTITPSSTPIDSNLSLNQSAIILIVIVAIAAVAISLVYFRK